MSSWDMTLSISLHAARHRDRIFAPSGHLPPRNQLSGICPWLKSGFRVIGLLFTVTVGITMVRVRIIRVRCVLQLEARIKIRVGLLKAQLELGLGFRVVVKVVVVK